MQKDIVHSSTICRELWYLHGKEAKKGSIFYIDMAELKKRYYIWFLWEPHRTFPANIYKFKVNNRNTRTRCEICSKLTKKTPEQRHWCHSGVFVNSEHISTPCSSVSTVNFEHVIVGWVEFNEIIILSFISRKEKTNSIVR